MSRPGFQAATLIAGVVLLVIIFVTAGFFFVLPAGETPEIDDPAFAALEENRALWARKRPASHEYIVDRDCVCPEDYDRPYRVQATPLTTVYTYDTVSAGDGVPPSAMDIDALFELTADAIAGANAVQVFYDADYGFPMILSIDWEEGGTDDEQAVDVRGFRAMP